MFRRLGTFCGFAWGCGFAVVFGVGIWCGGQFAIVVIRLGL